MVPPAIALGLFSQSIFVGGNIAISGVAMPAVRKTNTPADVQQRQWEVLYDNGSKIYATCSLISGISYFYAAYNNSVDDHHFKILLFTGATAISALPVTLLAIAPTVKKLKGLAGISSSEEAEQKGVGALIDKWSFLSFIRWSISATGLATYFYYLTQH